MLVGGARMVIRGLVGDEVIGLLGTLPLTGMTFLTLETVGNPPQNCIGRSRSIR
jgi:hypothetical protein